MIKKAVLLVAVLGASTQAFAGTLRFKATDLGTVTIVPGSIQNCGSVAPAPSALIAGASSPVISITCTAVPANYFLVTYTAGTKKCKFYMSSSSTPHSTGPDTWDLTDTADNNGTSATCTAKVTDLTNHDVDGSFGATFTMK